MFITDYIKVYENALPDSMCEDLIQRFESSANIREDVENLDNGLNIRTNLEVNLSTEPNNETVQETLKKITELAVNKYQAELPIRTFPKEIGLEVYRIKKYRSGDDFNDHFDYHVDVNSHSSARRYLALQWYLNDVTDRGETFFPHPHVRVKPRRGRLLIYPSLWMYPKAEERPESNDKYVLSTYLHYL